MIRWAFCLLSVVCLCCGCNRTDKPEIKQGPVGGDAADRPLVAEDTTRQPAVPGALPPDGNDRGRAGPVPGAIQETRPEIRAEIKPDRKPVDENSKNKDVKTPLVRILLDSLDQAEGGTAAEIDLTRKTLRQNDAILDQAFRNMGPLMQRANTRKAAIRITHPQYVKPAVKETKAVDTTEPKDTPAPSTVPSVPGSTGPATPPAGGE